MKRRALPVARGAALVEMVLVLPWMVMVLGLSVWMVRIVQLRMAAQEAAHSLVWDLAGRIENETWEERSPVAQARASEERPASAHIEGLEGWSVFLGRERDVSAGALAPVTTTQGPLAGAAAHLALFEGKDTLLRRWGFWSPPSLQATVRARLRNAWVTGSGMFGSLLRVGVSAREVLSGSDGHLEDGNEAHTRLEGSTETEEGAYLERVRAVTYPGGTAALFDSASELAALPGVPQGLSLTGTFLDSHAYHSETEGRSHCEGIPGYRDATGTESGLHDFVEPGHRGLDSPTPQCFDTAPFRDVHAYPRNGRTAGNLSMQQFFHRGDFFMGCQRSMSAHPGSSASGPHACENSQ